MSVLEVSVFLNSGPHNWKLTQEGRFILGFLKRFYLFIFGEKGRERQREGEKHQCVVASHTPPIGDLPHNPGMCPDWESNRQPFASQAALNPLNYTSQGHIVFMETSL